MTLPGFPDAQLLHGPAGGILISFAAALMLRGAHCPRQAAVTE